MTWLIMAIAIFIAWLIFYEWIGSRKLDKHIEYLNKKIGCSAIQYSDQTHCDLCNLTWDTNDTCPPRCKK